MKTTNPLPLKGYKYHTAQDLIKRQVQIEDTAEPYMPPIPQVKVEKKDWKEYVKVAMRWDAYVYSFKSVMP